MIRTLTCSILRLALRIYFRRIEVAGIANIPPDDPVIFVLNHPNALVDPAFLLCLTPRRVSFLAKAPLFRIPVVGYFVRALDSLPVYRRQDEGEDVARNLETFAAARQLLTGGGTIGICPEGVSHDEPRLKPLKTGAARIALGAVSTAADLDLKIVPVGLYYTSKTMFRSSALLYFGEPLQVQPVELQANGAPPRVVVRELSDRIEQAMREVMLHAENEDALGLIERAEKIFSAAEVSAADEEQSLTRELELRRRFLAGYAFHRVRSPKRLAALVARIARFEQELKQAGVDPSDLSLPPALQTTVRLAGHVASFMILAPLAVAGAVIHYFAYRLVGYLARRFSRDAEDVISTFKIIVAMLLFPFMWVALATIVWFLTGWYGAAATLLAVPVSGFVAMRFFEEIDEFAGSFLAVALFLMRRRSFVRLFAERAAIRREILALGDEAAVRIK